MRAAGRIILTLAAAVLAFGGLAAVGVGATGADPVGYTVIGNPFTTGPCQLARLDLVTGALTPFGPTDQTHCTVDLAMGPGNTALYGVNLQGTPPTPAHLIRYDPTSGAATDLGQIGAFTLGPGPGPLDGPLTFDAAGHLFVYLDPDTAVGPCGADAAFCLFELPDPTNPAHATPLGMGNATTVYAGLATAPAGTFYTVRLSIQTPCASGVACTAGAATTTTTAAAAGAAPTSTTTTRPPAGAGHAAGAPGGWAPISAASPEPFISVLATVNPANGSTTDVGSGLGLGEGVILESLDFDGSGTLWGLVEPPIATTSGTPLSTVATVNPSTGVASGDTAVTLDGTPTEVEALALPGAAAPAVVAVPTFTG